MANTLLIGATDLTRYDRTILLADWGTFIGGPALRGDDVLLPGMIGEVDGGRVATARSTAVTIELTGNTAAGVWASTHAQMVTDFHTNLATLKALLVGQFTITVQPLGTTCLARLEGPLDITLQAEFWAQVSIPLRLQEGTV